MEVPCNLSSDVYEEVISNPTMDLEPRLFDYVKAKLMFKKNNVIPMMRPEDEYFIKPSDIKKIKEFIKKNNYDMKIFSDYVDVEKTKFMGDDLKNDYRFKRLQRKQQLDRQARKEKDNYNIIKNNYGMYQTDFAAATSRTTPQVKPNGESYGSETRFQEDCFFRHGNVPKMDSKYYVQPIKTSSMTYTSEPVSPDILQYNEPLNWGENYMASDDEKKINSVIGKVDSYKHKVIRGDRYESEMDLANKIVIPANVSKCQREVQNDYIAMPYMKGSGESDIDIDTYLRFGQTPSRAAKTLGYPNTSEFCFNYINDDMQKPEHSVSDRPYPTRMLNRINNKPKVNRDIMR
jgi:hypothetical protein